ncbi:hypothetical protein J3E64_002349 [Sphingobium sp. OAS761]|uniref:GSCFA domain-containing protein n=1 Tax=Sphingobium sp. OAS761 TaxID=2817901 RepID=UPI00209DB597|nr:GSCFA domain-containing protein [Sphingobium sp. OAS761]MCP1470661.1 hypothetical protein [Sphingobium sp. OAS761]
MATKLKIQEKSSSNPYGDLPGKAFWRPAVADRSMFDIDELWTPKFRIAPKAPVATFGSCFAQHIGNALKNRHFNWLMAETPPPGMSEEGAKLYNYNVFSARTANIYTTSLLRQWTSWALGHGSPPDEYWRKGERYYDPFRPAIEPNGFESLAEMRQSREEVIKAFRACIENAHFFVFTLGLTESWFNRHEGYEYPMCPGTVAGEFDENAHEFRNQGFEEVRSALMDAIRMMRQANPKLRFILTVSPVPLTATKSDKHVLVATMYSKSVLRAVAGQVAMNHKLVDYFPSYEIINSAVFKGSFFEPNMRGVNKRGVDLVMDHFFQGLVHKFGDYFTASRRKAAVVRSKKLEEVCEEELLGAFGAAR